MKKNIINIEEMSDSKEVYGRRPNPFIAGFIYCLVALLAAGVVYSFLGHIDIVSTASGVIRPNEDVSTVSSLVGGKVTSVNYYDGQIVREGDDLLTVDMSETRIQLNSLRETADQLARKIELLNKYLTGLQTGINPFSADMQSDEYPYYTQFRNYLANLRNSRETIRFDVEKNKDNIQGLTEQIEDLKKQIDGLNAYQESIESGKDLAGDYPDYENMYRLYDESLAALKADYEAQRKKILEDASAADTQAANTEYYLDYYQQQLNDYNMLIQSVEKGESAFPAGSNSICVLMFDDYLINQEENRRNYENAKLAYDFYANGGGVGELGEKVLSFYRILKEGYEYYKLSVENDQDMFDETRDSIIYRPEYQQYKKQYDDLVEKCETAQTRYDDLLTSLESNRNRLAQLEEKKETSGLTMKEELEYNSLKSKISQQERDIPVYQAAIETARENRDKYKADTLLSLSQTIFQIDAEMAEKELNLNEETLAYNTAEAKMKMESAAAVMDYYQNAKLTEYRNSQAEIAAKITELQLQKPTATDRDGLLKALENSYQNSVAQKKYQALSQIGSSLRSLDSELLSAEANLRMYQTTAELYGSNVDEKGQPIQLSLLTLEQISGIAGELETAKNSQKDIDVQIDRAEEQLKQGTVKAEKSGVINQLATVVRGDNITSGSVFATIIPLNESELKAQIYISSAYVGKVKVGDTIRYNITALPSNQYGSVTGKVLSISQDAIVQDGKYSGYFMIEGSIDQTKLVDKDSNVGRVVVGMQVEAKIVTERKSIMNYLLEKLNIR